MSLGFLALLSLSALVAPSASSAPQTSAAEAQRAARVEAVIYSTRGDEKIHVLAAADLAPMASIVVGAGLHEVALDSSGRFLMGSAYGGPGAGHQPADNRLVVVDLAQRKIHRTIMLEGLQRPNDIAFVPGKPEAFVTVESPQHVLRVSAETG
ncbi:MAG: hypothetical protein SFY95_05175 [Planctomycetota bacterium]|nr:hypothetical protein [Planctomycetota bacterium]